MARLGTTRVVALGLVGLAARFATSLAWEPEMAYWPLGFGIGLAVAAGVALTGAAIVARLLPAHHRPAEASHPAPPASVKLAEAAGAGSA